MSRQGDWVLSSIGGDIVNRAKIQNRGTPDGPLVKPPGDLLRSGESGFVVGVLRDFADVFDVLDFTGTVDNEDGSSQTSIQWTTDDQDSVVVAEIGAAMGTERLDGFDAFSTTPALGSERQVHTDNQNFDVGQVLGFVVESLRFQRANAGVQGWNRRNDPGLARTRGQRDIGEGVVLQLEVWSIIPDLQRPPLQIDWISLESDRSNTLHLIDPCKNWVETIFTV